MLEPKRTISRASKSRRAENTTKPAKPVFNKTLMTVVASPKLARKKVNFTDNYLKEAASELGEQDLAGIEKLFENDISEEQTSNENDEKEETHSEPAPTTPMNLRTGKGKAEDGVEAAQSQLKQEKANMRTSARQLNLVEWSFILCITLLWVYLWCLNQPLYSIHINKKLV